MEYILVNYQYNFYKFSRFDVNLDMIKLLIITLLTFGLIFADDGGSRDCSDYNNQYDCELAGCEWYGGFLNVCIGEAEYVGDLNSDGVLNVIDVVTLVNMIMSDVEYTSQADLNGDGINNILDIISLVNLILNPILNYQSQLNQK